MRDPARALRAAVRNGDDTRVGGLIDWLLKSVPLVFTDGATPIITCAVIRGASDAPHNGLVFDVDGGGYVRAIRRPEEVPSLGLGDRIVTVDSAPLVGPLKEAIAPDTLATLGVWKRGAMASMRARLAREALDCALLEAAKSTGEPAACQVAERLLRARASPRCCDEGGLSALAWAAARGKPALCRVLIDAGASVEGERAPPTEPPPAYTPLQLGVLGGHVAVVALLLAAQADPHAPCAGGRQLIHLAVAARASAAELVELLLDPTDPSGGRQNLETRSEHGWSALFLAGGHAAALAAAATHPLPPLRTHCHCYAPIVAATHPRPPLRTHCHRYAPIVAAMHPLPPPRRARRTDRCTDRTTAPALPQPPHRTSACAPPAPPPSPTARAGAVSPASLGSRASLREAHTPQGRTTTTTRPHRTRRADRTTAAPDFPPLCVCVWECAAAADNLRMVKALLALGAPLGQRLRGRPLLHHAASCGASDVVAWLCAECAPQLPVDGADGKGRTPLLLAARGSHTATIEVLLSAGASPAHDAHLALSDPRVSEATRVLVGTAVRHWRRGRSALLLEAAAAGNVGLMRTLHREQGADILHVDERGYSALHHACAGGHEPAVLYLMQLGRAPPRTQSGDLMFRLPASHLALAVCHDFRVVPSDDPHTPAPDCGPKAAYPLVATPWWPLRYLRWSLTVPCLLLCRPAPSEALVAASTADAGARADWQPASLASSERVRALLDDFASGGERRQAVVMRARRHAVQHREVLPVVPDPRQLGVSS